MHRRPGIRERLQREIGDVDQLGNFGFVLMPERHRVVHRHGQHFAFRIKTQVGQRLDAIGQAIAQSQQLLMDDAQTSHPFYWSAFAVIGGAARPLISSPDAAPMADLAFADQREGGQ